MCPENIKILALNGSTLGVTTLTNIEIGLKIILLVVTIGYTISKWLEIKNEK